MSLYGLTRNFYPYTSDNGNLYQVALTTDDAAAGGFGDPEPAGTNPTFPRGWKMRIQYGVNGATRTKTPVATPALEQWTAPTTFTKKAVVFQTQGCRGEQRYDKT